MELRKCVYINFTIFIQRMKVFILLLLFYYYYLFIIYYFRMKNVTLINTYGVTEVCLSILPYLFNE